MEYKKGLSLVLSIMILFSCLGTGCSEDSNANHEKQSSVAQSFHEASVSAPTASLQKIQISDPMSNGSVKKSSSKIPSYNYVSSYYIQFLSQQNQQIYSKLKDSIKACQTDIFLSEPCSQSDFQKIINILYFDTPELFNFKPSYKVELNDAGSVYELKPEYYYSKEEYVNKKTSLENLVQSKIHEAKTDNLSDYQYEQKILSYIFSFPCLISNDNLPSSVYEPTKDSAYNPLSGNEGSPLSIAKSFSWFCQAAGIECPVVLGELVNYDGYAKTQNSNVPAFKNICYKQVASKKNVQEISTTIDFNGMYAWNMINLSDKWYHVDIPFSLYSKKVSSNSYSWGINIFDSMLAENHIFHWNDEILGLSPSAKDDNLYAPISKSSGTFNYSFFIRSKDVQGIQNDLKEAFKNISSDNIANIKLCIGTENEATYQKLQEILNNQSTVGTSSNNESAIISQYSFSLDNYPDLMILSLSKFYRK